MRAQERGTAWWMALIAWTLVALAIASSADAQLRPEAYVAGGPGVFSTRTTSGLVAHGAGGGDVLLGGVVGPEVEVGGIAGQGSAYLTLSVGGVIGYKKSDRARPFFTLGSTSLIGADRRLTIGGGVDVPISVQRAVRFEFRHLRPGNQTTSKIFLVRLGMTFS